MKIRVLHYENHQIITSWADERVEVKDVKWIMNDMNRPDQNFN